MDGKYNNQKNEREGKELEVNSEIPIFITQGYSRDHRPDLKQCVLDLIVSSDGDIPIFIRGGSGNEADKAMFGKILVEYSKQVDFESIMIADSALYSAKNLILIKDLKMMLMGLSLLVYTIGQREIRNNLQAGKSSVKNQLNKLTERPTLRWIFQCFQGIHCFKIEGLEKISNLSEERCRILGFLPVACQRYYLAT